MSKPLDQIVDFLSARVRTDATGAFSLAHVLVVVPTLQSGRRLRQALARRFARGLVPPLVKMPIHVLGLERFNLARRADELLAFWEAAGAKGSLDVSAQLADIRGILGANALSFADVAARVGEILTDDLADVEVARWKELATLEVRYREALARRGREDRIAALCAAIENPPVYEEVEEIVVAAVLDPLPVLHRALDKIAARDGVTVTEFMPTFDDRLLERWQIVPSGTAVSESSKIAALYAAVATDEALPALCLVDPTLFPELQGALQARGLRLHNPSATRLATSSLGQLVAQLVALRCTRSYSVFSAFIRSGDARRWLAEELNLTVSELTAAFVDLDNRQAKYLPEKIDDISSKTSGKLRAIFEFLNVQLRKKGVRELLQSIFKGRLLDEHEADSREFVAAAEVVNQLIDECFDSNVPETVAHELFERRLQESTYALEPDEGEVIVSDGWLELPYLDADELYIAGFQEGCVPESVVGHAFLPDALRHGLGLPDNDTRYHRDLKILKMALSCRPPENVRVFFHAVDAAGDVLKPSRLLFDGTDDSELIARVRTFYSQRAGTEEMATADFPPEWRLRLEIPPPLRELTYTSPSSLDNYLKCPFTYLLDKTFGERMDDRAEELDPSEFGHLAHDALEAWAQGPLRDSDDADAIAKMLGAEVDRLLADRFGLEIPVIVALQGESVRRRLAHFASIQAARRRAGWRLVASERKLKVRYGHTLVSGRCDRIDYNEQMGVWCVIDYKTWDTTERVQCFDSKKNVWKSLQLPLYCAMLDADNDPAFAAAHLDRITSAYCVLGKTADQVLFSEPMSGALVREAEEKVRALIACIERGIFWPPASTMEWRWNFTPWIFGSPEESVDLAWIADQERRLAAEEVSS